MKGKKPLYTLSFEWELIEPVRSIIEISDLNCHHVRGHQDDRNVELTEVECLNVRADKLTEEGRQMQLQDENLPGFLRNVINIRKPSYHKICPKNTTWFLNSWNRGILSQENAMDVYPTLSHWLGLNPRIIKKPSGGTEI